MPHSMVLPSPHAPLAAPLTGRDAMNTSGKTQIAPFRMVTMAHLKRHLAEVPADGTES